MEFDGRARLLLSQRGKKMLLWQRRHYYFWRENDTASTYRCANKTCTGRCVFDGEHCTMVMAHVCSPLDVGALIKIDRRAKLRDLSSSSLLPTRSVVNIALSGLDANEIQSNMSLKAMHRTSQNVRQKNLMSTVLENNDIPEELKKTVSGNNFLLYDDGAQDPNRILIFGNEENLAYLKSAEIWICDGTFYSSPPEFFQIYVIFCSVFGKFVPVCFSLLKTKNRETYNTMFSKLSGLMDGCSPLFAVFDFEVAPMNAFSQCFPTATTFNCLFHFGQIVWRRIQQTGLVHVYNNYMNIRFAIKSLMAVVFLPKHRITREYLSMRTNILINAPQDAKKPLGELCDFLFNNYFEAIISIDSYKGVSAFTRVMLKIPLTNNCCEGWNRSLNNNFINSHPSLARFLLHLRTIESTVETSLNEIIAQGNIDNTKTDPKLENIKKILKNEADYPEGILLKAIALNYSWKLE